MEGKPSLKVKTSKKLGNLKTTAKQQLSKIRNLNREKMLAFLMKYGLRILAVSLLIGSIIFYFTYSQNRRIKRQE